MTPIQKLILPVALLLGACDSDDPDDADDADAEVANAADASTDREGRFAGKFAKLDADHDGSISKAEVEGHKMAARFDDIDADKNGLLSKDEFFAAKKGHHGKGERGHGDPAERAAKMMEKLDADHDGAISKDESTGHRFLGDKFAEIDADADGKITAAELTAFKAAHHGRKHGPKQQANG